MLPCRLSRRRSRKRYCSRRSLPGSRARRTPAAAARRPPTAPRSRWRHAPRSRRWQVRVDGARAARATTSPSTRITLSARTLVRDLEAGLAGVGDHLGQPIVVAQVDEQAARRGRACGGPSPTGAHCGRRRRGARRRRCGSDSDAELQHPTCRRALARCSSPLFACFFAFASAIVPSRPANASELNYADMDYRKSREKRMGSSGCQGWGADGIGYLGAAVAIAMAPRASCFLQYATGRLPAGLGYRGAASLL